MRKLVLNILYNANRLVPAELWIKDDGDLIELRLLSEGVDITVQSEYDFEALTKLRLFLENEGGLIQCNGADRQVYPSRMQMECGGEKAYKLSLGKQALMADVCDIFETDKPGLQPVTVAEQEAFYQEWLASLRVGR